MMMNEIRVNIEAVANKCFKHGIYAIEGELPKRTLYAENDGEIAILQADGWLRMQMKDIPSFIHELQEIYDDCKFREHEKLRLEVPKREYCRCKVDSGELLNAFKAGKTNREIESEMGLSRSYVAGRRFKFKEAGML